MSNCSFLKTPAEMALAKDGTNPPWMNNCEGVYAAWETDPELLAKLVPAPLTPAMPLVIAYVIEAHNPTFSTAYKEAAIMTLVTDGEMMGNYCFGLLLTGSDDPVTTGREELGIPKKNADKIDIRRVGDKAYATVDRYGVRVIDIELDLGDYNCEAGAKVLGGKTFNEYSDGCSYFYKFDIDQAADCSVVFSNARLLRVKMRRLFRAWDAASAQIKMTPSINDPWAELFVKAPLGGAWGNFDLGILGCQKTTPIDDIDALIPHLIAGRYDSPFFGQPCQVLL